MDNNLVIVEEYVTNVGNSCKTKGGVLDDAILADYIATLKTIREIGIKDGDIAQALSAYIGCAEIMRSKVATISEYMQTLCDSFLTEVDGIDQYTF